MKEQLTVQVKAAQLVEDVYKATGYYPESESRGLARQMRNASTSIVSNIAEGRARASLKEYIRFVNIAYASGKELEMQIKISRRIGYLTKDEERTLLFSVDEVLRMSWILQTQLAHLQ